MKLNIFYRSLWVELKPILMTGAFLLALLGCQKAQPRQYSEIAFKPLAPTGQSPMMGGPMVAGNGSTAMAMNTSPVDIKVTWKLPEDWMIKDSAIGMRIGSFSIPDERLVNTGELDPRGVDVSVVQLAGNAGGLKPNIIRWMGQIGLKSTPEELDELIAKAAHFKTQTGQEGFFVDLTDKLSGDMTQNKTIYGAIISTQDYTVFIKAMGEIERVIKIKNDVKAFSESISITGPQA